jgi:CRP-like cAMP-binding protein
VVATYGPGDYFGEIALLTDEPTRTATVTATSDAEVLGLTKWDFRALVNAEPDVALEVMAELARRLEETQSLSE